MWFQRIHRGVQGKDSGIKPGKIRNRQKTQYKRKRKICHQNQIIKRQKRKMTLKIIEEKNNPLFGRKEIKAVIESEKTPSRVQILELLSKKFSASPETIKIRGIKGSFGVKSFNIEANIYQSKEEKEMIELKKKKEGAVKQNA